MTVTQTAVSGNHGKSMFSLLAFLMVFLMDLADMALFMYFLPSLFAFECVTKDKGFPDAAVIDVCSTNVRLVSFVVISASAPSSPTSNVSSSPNTCAFSTLH
jgi:hypothetical protein